MQVSVISISCSLAAVASAMLPSQGVSGVGAGRATGADITSNASSVYTREQADRGEKTYVQHCETCHQGDLLGFDYNPPLVGSTFLSTWKGRTLAELFSKTQQTMPKTAPNSLSPQEYADVISYVLRMNGGRPGVAELRPDVERLKRVVIQPSDK